MCLPVVWLSVLFIIQVYPSLSLYIYIYIQIYIYWSVTNYLLFVLCLFLRYSAWHPVRRRCVFSCNNLWLVMLFKRLWFPQHITIVACSDQAATTQVNAGAVKQFPTFCQQTRLSCHLSVKLMFVLEHRHVYKSVYSVIFCVNE